MKKLISTVALGLMLAPALAHAGPRLQIPALKLHPEFRPCDVQAVCSPVDVRKARLVKLHDFVRKTLSFEVDISGRYAKDMALKFNWTTKAFFVVKTF